MAFRYTPEQLLHLKQSPLVRKPDELPSIDQWMEGQKQAKDDQAGGRRKTQPTTRDDHDNTLARLAGNARRPRQTEGDGVLGPPKMNFTSNSRNQIRTDTPERRTPRSYSESTSIKDNADFQDGFFRSQNDFTQPRERQNGARRTRDGDGNRWDRLEDRGDKERKPRDADGSEAPLRRNGVGRGRPEGEWNRSDQQNGANESGRDVRSFSWREGARDNQRDKDSRDTEHIRDRDRGRRDWNRQNRYDAQAEEEPEWMNDAPEVEEKEAKTQDDFQKWKDQQKRLLASKNGIIEEDIEDLPETVPKPPAISSKSTGVLPTLGNAFGTFQDPRLENTDDKSAIASTNKKASRFEGLFKKEDPPQSLPLLGAFNASSPRPISSDHTINEDQEGFQRILMMLGNKGLTPKPMHVDNKPKDHVTSAGDDMDHSVQAIRTSDHKRDSAGFINDILARQMASQERNEGRNVDHMSRDFDQFHLSQHNHHDEPRAVAEPQGNGQSSRDRRQPSSNIPQDGPSPLALEPNKAFLLNLMNNRMAEPPRQAESMDFLHSIESTKPPMSQPGSIVQRHAPSAPPGFDPQRRPNQKADASSNRRPPQPPPGFYDQEAQLPNMTMPPPGLPRRNTAESGLPPGQMGRPVPSQASNLGIPSMRMNEGMMMRNGGHVGLDSRLISGPPPGLLPNSVSQSHQHPQPMPPGLTGPGIPSGMRPNMPPMGPPGFPPHGMPMNMHNLQHGPGHFPMGMPHPQHSGQFNNGPPPPGMFQNLPGPGQPGFFPPGGRGFPPGFDNEMRGAPPGRGYQGQ